MAEDREVAGIRCTAVLERLSDYLDDELDPELRRTIEAHLAGCDWCARFGGRISGIVRDVRSQLGRAEVLDAEVSARLLRRLAGE